VSSHKALSFENVILFIRDGILNLPKIFSVQIKIFWGLCCALFFGATFLPCRAQTEKELRNLRKDVDFLASDKLEGRMTGTKG
jgi:hypothetical protein